MREGTSEKVGYRVREWCDAVGISRPSFYNLEGDLAPRTVRINSMPIITESPAAYLARVAALTNRDPRAA
jgi:hypothetical protein